MIQYQVNLPFVDYGIPHAIGEIITDASIVSDLTLRIQNTYLIPMDDAAEVKAAPVAQPIVAKTAAPKTGTTTTKTPV